MRRFIDLVAAVSGLALLSPLFAIVALIVAVESPGNPFYGGRRVGRGGRTFRMWKFRTMVKDADRVGPGITGRRDPRITRVGAFLRRTKIDELPQFANLLLGDVTLVGPRAEVPDIVARYTEPQREILAFTPGIVGPGQLYYTTDQQHEIPEGVAADDYYVERLLAPKLAIDLEYVEHRTPWSDARMVLATAGVMLRGLLGKGA
jgi:lipopolysaccharide/colanic/teichoic acid biosynthesis glycosyltransferase